MSNLLSFANRAEQMNLRDIGNEGFQYDDNIGSVIYKHLHTKDLVDVPLYAIFTRPPVENIDFTYAGYVSDSYQFEGNDIMNQKIKESIAEVGTPVFREYVYLNPQRTRMSNEIIIQHSENIPQIGDVYPQIVVKNTYDGSGAREFLFGFTVLEENSKVLGFGFQNKIGKIRQVHNMYAKTLFSTPINKYIDFFSENILTIIQTNFNTEISEDHLLSVFDMIEKVGKKRRIDISSYIADLTKETNGKINAWNLFVAITRFSSIQKNVNIKTLLDGIAERVLVIPVQIQEVIKTLEK